MMILQGRKNPRAAFQVVDQLNNNGPGVAQRSPGLIAKTKRHFLVRGKIVCVNKNSVYLAKKEKRRHLLPGCKKNQTTLWLRHETCCKRCQRCRDTRERECPPESTWWVVTSLRKPLVKSVTCLPLHFHYVLDPHVHSFWLQSAFYSFPKSRFCLKLAYFKPT